MNSLLFYVFVILSVMVGVLAERGIRGKAGSLITGFAAGTCIILAAVNLYFRNWISVILVVALFFWLPKLGPPSPSSSEGNSIRWTAPTGYICSHSPPSSATRYTAR